MATNFPSEIITEICFHLSPSDLYSLSSVCKRFRSLLWSMSTTTQDIWRKSRLRHSTLTLPPPLLRSTSSSRMSEQQYIWLMFLAEKCQFCDQKNKIKLTLYWEGKIYCCDECLKKKVISGRALKSELNRLNVPEDLLQCLTESSYPELPYSFNTIDWHSQTYFISEVESLLKEHNEENEHEEVDWIEKKKCRIRELKNENECYKELHVLCKYTVANRVQRELFRSERMSDMEDCKIEFKNNGRFEELKNAFNNLYITG